MSDNAPDPKSEAEVESLREMADVQHPGKLPGEGSGPAEGSPSGGDDLDSAATGAGPSGGAPSGDTGAGDGSATGAGPSGGADTGGGGTAGGDATGAGPSGGA